MSNQNSVLSRLVDYAMGPMRFMNLLSCFELGIIETVRKAPGGGVTSQEIAAETETPPDAVEQLLRLMVKENFLSYDRKSTRYAIDGLGHLTDFDLDRITYGMQMIKTVCLRQLYYLSQSVREQRVVGLREIYGFDGNFYEASVKHPELRAPWSAVMDLLTSMIDPWFLEHVDFKQDSRVLDVAGNTGLGAILAQQQAQSMNVHVTCFDLPEKETEALANFYDNDMQSVCSYVGGDVFREPPGGYDIAFVKHFLEMFNEKDARHILENIHGALNPGGELYILAPIYPDDVRGSNSVDFFPSYFLGCTMGQGGPQDLATYATWVEDSGFKVTKRIVQDTSLMPPDVFITYAIICGVKDT
ncbi:methyltransferase [Streptomyces sp. SP18BB07]|uniref:methyltransferase n=1 Tax=Streptomyces sp. SP18BB07 TaxID=3002522 RepID=UPI002E78E7CA|nr:methyltransferase [Streptomyces sp. SP18BB07]MEE1757544.1 methyltransferase [Streptomyces sp. SP18BB07]